ncbi:MAG: ABC transporter [Alphaproteobacteria bacterium HGW-Alphaproteobacteria-16]|nr:MAG: ABC transporter [Alphaproteobacteria bacterium HGW-Alphaproteobacteria-16]
MLNAGPARRFRSSTLDGLDAQRHVIGALIIRELHTRYGRDNIGYLWMLAEPMLLAGAVALIHIGEPTSAHYGSDFRVIPFTLTGYCVFIILRSIVSRAETTLDANKPLLFHRVVTIFDLLLSRAILETLSSVGALLILLSGAVALGVADPPARPLLLLAGIGFIAWLSFAISLAVCTAAHFSRAVAKLVHPAIYLMMPLSGAFFLLKWIPEPYRSALAWSPINQIFEMVHVGQFASLESPYYDPVYIAGWCLGLTVLGLFALRVLRRHVHLG